VVAGNVGFAWFGPAIGLADAGELYLVCVEPDRWRTGIGSALMAATAERLRAMGWSTAVPWTGEANTAARRAYEANGWTPDGATQAAMRTGTSS
jgi:GNAT superfamily N-acetyltransferase